MYKGCPDYKSIIGEEINRRRESLENHTRMLIACKTSTLIALENS